MGYSIFSHQKIFEKIKWCVANDPSSYNFENQHCNIKLRNVIFQLQSNLSVDIKYRVTAEENEFVDKIIFAYQHALIQEYFRGFAVNYNFSYKDYYIVTLQDFLQKNVDETTFLGQKMYIPKSHNETATLYELTDFAVTFQKLYYISTLKYVLLTGESQESWIYKKMEAAKEEIDTKTVTMLRYY